MVDDPATLKYPMPLNVTTKWDVEVGRIRSNLCFGDHGLEFFVSGDHRYHKVTFPKSDLTNYTLTKRTLHFMIQNRDNEDWRHS